VLITGGPRLPLLNGKPNSRSGGRTMVTKRIKYKARSWSGSWPLSWSRSLSRSWSMSGSRFESGSWSLSRSGSGSD